MVEVLGFGVAAGLTSVEGFGGSQWCMLGKCLLRVGEAMWAALQARRSAMSCRVVGSWCVLAAIA